MRINIIDDSDPALISKKFWSHVKSTSNSARIPETVCYKGKFRSNPKDQADIFNTFFHDQFSAPSKYDTNINFENDCFVKLNFNENKIYHILRTLNPSKAAGPDGIHGQILKHCASSLAQPLSILYNISFKTGQIPDEWKLANVVPVFKKGDKRSVENYRPISLTCLVMKVFEYCIRDEIMLKCKDLLDIRQHGFMPMKSCTTQLVPFVQDLAFTLNEHSRTDVIYFDFAKAFDSVSHDVILHKLKHEYKIDGCMLKFIESYLQNMLQRVVIGGSYSHNLPVKSGVPQGSILGPLLFVMFINDMFKCVSPGTNIALYADDTKIWRRIEFDIDHEHLQNDITALFKWSKDNKMVFHPNKCKTLVVTAQHENNILPFDRYPYHLDGSYLDYIQHEKDLGIHMTTKLSWGLHCNNLISKANAQLGLVRRTCHFTKNVSQKRVLYLTLVRSIFEHSSILWHPYTTTHMNKFDCLQKRAVKWILSEHLSHYSDGEFLQKQAKLDILPMEHKFLYTDLVLFHKIVNKSVKISMPPYISVITLESSRVSRNNTTLAPTGSICDIDHSNVVESNDDLQYRCNILPRVDAFRFSFFYRTVLEWNKVPLKIRQITNTNSFSNILKQHLWKLLLDKPD